MEPENERSLCGMSIIISLKHTPRKGLGQVARGLSSVCVWKRWEELRTN